MASGDIVGIVTSISFPNSTGTATPDIRLGGSNENIPVYDFDSSSDEILDFNGILRNYAGGGLTIEIKWATSTAPTGTCVWQGAFRAFPENSEYIPAAHSYDYNFVQAIAPTSGSGYVSYDDITFTDGVDMDSLANEEQFIFRLRRDADSTAATDNMTGDAELVSILITET